MLSQAKQIYRVILVLFLVLSSSLAKFYRMSGNSSFNLPQRSPATTTFTLFLVTMSKMLSCSYIYDKLWNCSRASSIKNYSYSGLRLKFYIENAQKEACWTPNYRQQSRHFFKVFVPYTWPSKSFRFQLLANLRLPSMIKATCLGTLPCLSTLIAIFSRQVSSSMMMCQLYMIICRMGIRQCWLIKQIKSGILINQQGIYTSEDMFDQRLKQILQMIYSGRVIVFSNYKIRETLFSKGITPAIFLNQFYQRKSGENRIEYYVKEKGVRELADVLPIDIEEYEWHKEEKIKTILRERVYANYKLKPSKDISKEDLVNKDLSQNFLRSLNFSWFEDASRYFLYFMTLDEQNYKISTLEQPLGLTFLIELDANTNIKNEYEKIRKQSELRIKKMFTLNPQRTKGIPVMVILLYSKQSKVTYQDAQRHFQTLRYEHKLEMDITCVVEINGSQAQDMTQWSNYERPIFNIQYKLQPSDPIRLIGDNEEIALRTIVNNHKMKIREHIQNRLRDLCRRYEQTNTAKNRFLNFFKGSNAVQRSYSAEEAETRQIADYLFILGDYKRAVDLFKVLAEKFQPNERDQTIYYNVCEMIQLSKCLNIFSPNHNNINRMKVYESIQKYAEKFMIKKVAGLSKFKLNRYLTYLLYFFHCFKVFNKDFIKNNFYYYIKKNVNEETVNPNYPNPLIIPALLHEQFANLNLLYPNPEFRRYCYDLVRVASKFSQYKLYYHHLRCILITNKIYDGTFPLIQRYVNTSLCKTYFQMKKHRQAINSYKNTWNLLLKNYEQIGSNEQQSQFVKFQGNYKKIVYQIQKSNAAQLQRESNECISMPKVTNIVIELSDELIDSSENLGSTWQQVGDIFLERPQLTSKGMNKQNMVKMLKMFDSVTPEERQLAFRARNLNMTNVLSEAIMKRNSRTSFANQPILFTFDMKNTLPNPIQFESVELHLKNPKKCSIKMKNKTQKFQVPPHHSVSITFQIIPYEPGLYEFSHLSWTFSKIKSIFTFKQPWECRSTDKSLYFKINVLEQTGIMKVQIKHNHKHYQGQLAQLQFVFRNHGKEEIDEVYLAIQNESIFGFKLKRFDFSVMPGQTKYEELKVKIPLFQSHKNHSNYWKCVNKSIFLYKTGSSFRVLRTVTIFNIYRIADIYNIACERISRTLHFLSFSVKYENADQEKLHYLKSLVIDGGLQIKKWQHNQFGLSITQYFFFLRKNSDKDLEEYKFTIHGLQCADLIRNNYKKSAEIVSDEANNSAKKLQNSVKLYFLWCDQQNNIGVIDPKPIPITATQNTDLRIKLPFNVKIMLQDDIQFNFQKNVFLQLEVQFRIKNIFDPKDINVCIDLTESANNDLYWQGITQHILHLRYNEESKFKMKLMIFRSGVYNIAKNIKYIISINKANSYTINHYEYENLFIMVRNQRSLHEMIQQEAKQEVQAANQFDFFQHFEPISFKKNEKKEEEEDSLI